eukprot:scaffold7059_cov118-Skeletonema_dohrnii-CCMP3373.AAC.4
MNDPTGVALLRGYENLHHIMNAKKMLGKSVFESLVPLRENVRSFKGICVTLPLICRNTTNIWHWEV